MKETYKKPLVILENLKISEYIASCGDVFIFDPLNGESIPIAVFSPTITSCRNSIESLLDYTGISIDTTSQTISYGEEFNMMLCYSAQTPAPMGNIFES